MTSLVVRKVIKLGKPRRRLVQVCPKVLSEGVLKLERVRVLCPACGLPVEAVTSDGRVKGYCAVVKQYVDFPIETQSVPTGKEPTAETRVKLSTIQKKLWQDPKYQARHSAGMKKLWQDPEYRTRHIAASKERWQDPEYRAKQVASHNATSKKLGQYPELRAKLSAASKEPWQNSESRARHSAAMKRRWQDPEYRAKQIASKTGKHPTAKTKAKISAALKKRFNAERGASERTG